MAHVRICGSPGRATALGHPAGESERLEAGSWPHGAGWREIGTLRDMGGFAPDTDRACISPILVVVSPTL